ncbi:hypothetical protein J7E70_34725 [Variovorax paradoxus]|nr:hypothetical protein [Variovorax paradoxus]MBT2305548.1 hypothetical protein [Variovorax paradoxus]
MPGTWATLTNAPPAQVATCFLLTDGTVLAQGVSTNHWYRLTPDASGSYANGTWATMADSVHAPLYYASGVLRDGRVIVVGGEYDAGAMVWLLGAEMYNPVSNTWTTLPVPAGWVRIGDAPGCVLPDGRFFVGQVATRNTAIYDPVTNAWTAAANKISAVGEESWSLLPDGTIHAVDCSNPPNAEKYIIASNQWVAAGATPQVLVDSISEIGASALLPDGRIFVIGATGFTALYTPPPIANQLGTWVQGPTIPQVNVNQPLGAVDAPAVVLPNGNVLFTAGPITSPATFQAPTFFFEYDPTANAITAVPAAATSAEVPYWGRMLMLPNGQAMYTAGDTVVSLYTPGGAPDPVWLPTITSCPSSVRRGRTYTLAGRQINGLTQCVYYGNDATQATNYPIVRLESGSHIYYCRTSGYSTMGLQTGTIIHTCNFTVPASVPLGSYCLRVIANGIGSACRRVGVTNKWFKELKYEIKEKLEIVENLKEIRDVNTKRLPDIDDIKRIREEIDVNIFDKIQEEWVQNVRTLAQNVDQANEELSRTFIVPDERPVVGPPPPVIDELKVPRISAEQARIGQEKRAFKDGRKELAVSKQAEEFHKLVHSLSRSGGNVDAGGTDAVVTTKTKKRTPRRKKE